MIKYLVKKIRRQPKPVRDNIALGVAGSFTAIVFMVWLYHMPVRNAAVVELQKDDSSPGFSQLFQGVGEQVSAIKEAVKDDSSEEVVSSEQPEVETFELTDIPSPAPASTEDSIVSTASSTEVVNEKPKTLISPVLTEREVRIVTTPTTLENSTTTPINE